MAPDAGHIEILGESLAAGRPALLGRVGTLVETPALYGHLSGRENLRLVALLRGLAPKEVDRVLGLVRLEADAERRVGTYSLGMKQRMGLATALLGNPELLILDEPTNGLDPSGIREIRELVAELPRRQGVTVFLSSHRLDEVRQIARRLVVIRQGRQVFEGPVEGFGAQPATTRFETSDAASTLALARARDLDADLDPEGTVEVRGADREETAALCRALVEAGIDLYRVEPRSEGIEAAFLDLTRDGAENP